MLTLDTSAILALIDNREREHERASTVIERDRGPFVVPAGVLCEVGYMVQRRLGGRFLDRFLASIQSGEVTLDCGDEDLPRVRELIARYADLPLGYSDATVIACAERSGGAVLSFDRRDFDVVAREGTIRVVPEP